MKKESTFFEVREILFPAHVGRSHVGVDDIGVDFPIGGNDYGVATSFSCISPMVSLLPIKNKTSLQEYTFKNLPVNRGYAW